MILYIDIVYVQIIQLLIYIKNTATSLSDYTPSFYNCSFDLRALFLVSTHWLQVLILTRYLNHLLA